MTGLFLINIDKIMNEESVLKRPSSFWIAIGAAVLTGVIAFTNLQNRVEAMHTRQDNFDTRIVNLENKIDLLIEVNNSIKIRQAQIAKDVEFIKTTVEQ